MNWTSSGFHDCVNMYTCSWSIFLCTSIYVNCTSSGILDLWTCTRYSGRSSLCTARDLYKPWITWLCEYVHVILADLPCVPYMNCTSPGFLDCVNMYTWQVTDIPPSLDILYIHYMLIGNSEQTHKHYIETEIINVNIDIFTLTNLFLVFYVEV